MTIADAEYWDAKAATIQGARDAVWSEVGWEVGVHESVRAIESGILNVLGAKPPPDNTAVRVLEIGCGIGRLTVPIAARWPHIEFVGLDISQAMLIQAVHRAMAAGVTNIRWELSEEPDEMFDAAYSMLVFQHLEPDVAHRYIDDVAAHLWPGGAFHFQFVVGDHHQGYDHRYRTTQLLDWCRDAGLTLVSFAQGIMHPEWCWITARSMT